MESYHFAEDDRGRRIPVLRRDGRWVGAELPRRLRGLEGRSFETQMPGREIGSVDAVSVCPPTDPSKIVGIGRNYRAHAEEFDNPVPEEPLVFLKAPSALASDGQPVRLPPQSDEVHHEAELAVVIGERTSRCSVDAAGDAVAGYTCANDVTARDLQRRDKTFARGKGFDTFCPVGPGLVPADVFEPSDHRVVCRVDGEERQSSGLDDFIFPVDELVAYVSDIMTLEPGDLVLTGTPAGVGPLTAGSTVEVEIDGIGTLSNPVELR